MAKISAADVKNLREATGAGMMDCKKALVEAEGNFDKAIDVFYVKKVKKLLQKELIENLQKESAVTKNKRQTTPLGVAIVLACETDFVGKNDSFVKL